jgi:UTP--glucose-1-phosphate uridylyltransferase
MKRVNKVVIPVAGLGTRGLPFTKEVPKEMLPILDTPTIHYIVEEVIAAGIEQVIFVTSKGKSALEDYFDPSPALENWLIKRGKEALAEKIRRIGNLVEVISVRQKEPLGLGHAILCARDVINQESFAVCLGDEIFPPWEGPNQQKSVLQRLVEASESTRGSVVGVVEIPKSDSTSYGVIDIGSDVLGDGPTKVLRTVEKPKPQDAPSPFAIIGRYVFEAELMDHLREVRPGVGGEIQLTDGMDRLCRSGKLFALQVKGPRYDIGNHFFYLKAQIDEALRRPELAQKLRHYLKTL